MTFLTGFFFRALVVLAAGAALFLALKLLAGSIVLLPGARVHRVRVGQALPVVVLVLVIAYAAFGLSYLVGTVAGPSLVVFGGVLGLSALASFAPIRDAMLGVVLRAGGFAAPGDTLQVGDVRGRVTRVGYRVVVLETAMAEVVSVPFSQLVKQAVTRTPANTGAVPHVFHLELPADHVPEVVRELKLAALENHWSSLVRMPELRMLSDGQCEVTVYALSAAHAPEIEAAVRGVQITTAASG